MARASDHRIVQVATFGFDENALTRISLANFRYHVGRWLAAETVDVTITIDGLVEITYRGVLVATHARHHPPEAEPEVWRRQPPARPVRPATVG